ncbi:MAG: PIN domain-containing protein [Candidatus Lokiarchaeota archaeon]|nr:PIN domain-containing protein [Candidatus Lokiarchaeota archaeon]
MNHLPREFRGDIMNLLDTCFVIDLMKGRTDCKVFLQDRKAQGQDVFLSTVSVYELLVGLAHTHNKKLEEQKIKNALSLLPTISFDMIASRESGAIYFELKSCGQILKGYDILIAGIARANNYSIVTRDGKHFHRINGLQVIEY